MRIIFWTELYWPHIGGVEVRSHQLAVALRDRGHEVAVITSHGNLALPDHAVQDGIEIRRFRFLEALRDKRLDLLGAARMMVRDFKREFKPDVVQVFFTDPSVVFHWMTQTAAKAPTVVSIPIGIDALEASQQTLLHKTLTEADHVIAISRAMHDDVIALAPNVTDRSSVIYNSLDMPLEEPSALEFHPPILLCMGRLVNPKGYDVLIEALPAILQQLPEAQLWIAGDGPESGLLRDQASRLGVAEHVKFLGWVDPPSLPGVINQSTLVVVPSRWREAFGNVALQAMQMGRPVVAAATGGLPEVVDDGNTGFLVPPEDAVALAAAVLRILENQARAVEFGKAGRILAATQFSFLTYVEQHETLYAKLRALDE